MFWEALFGIYKERLGSAVIHQLQDCGLRKKIH